MNEPASVLSQCNWKTDRIPFVNKGNDRMILFVCESVTISSGVSRILQCATPAAGTVLKTLTASALITGYETFAGNSDENLFMIRITKRGRLHRPPLKGRLKQRGPGFSVGSVGGGTDGGVSVKKKKGLGLTSLKCWLVFMMNGVLSVLSTFIQPWPRNSLRGQQTLAAHAGRPIRPVSTLRPEDSPGILVLTINKFLILKEEPQIMKSESYAYSNSLTRFVRVNKTVYP